LNSTIKILHNSEGGHADNVFDVVAKLLPNKPQRIIDLGCGAFRWIKKDYDITRVDIKNFNDNIVYDLNREFPFKDKEFDGVIAIELIEHLKNPFKFLKECFRISKEWVMITTPDITKQWVKEKWFGKNADIYGHVSPCNIDIFKLACEENDWKIETIRYSQVSIIVKMIPKKQILFK
jgi:2-polyprenyl-3-methyl-5-hydroxy-6-metoxy-1,4-benzoquinol methylase